MERSELIETSFQTVRSALAEFARRQGLVFSEELEIEFPSVSLDADGRPRFSMNLPASLIANDLGAGALFYYETTKHGFEFALRRFLDLHLLSDDVFIDLGAHWGIHALTAASRWPGQVSVVAIEAYPDNSARLMSWAERNHLEGDVEVVSTAVGDRVGVARLWVDGSSMGHNLRTDNSNNAGLTAIDVGMTTVDALFAARPHLHWRRIIMKIDVEGFELEALTGARRLLSTGNVAAVIWEKAPFHDPAAQERRNGEIFAFLNAHGLQHFYMEDEKRGGRLLPLEGKDMLCNIYSLAPNFDRKERYD